MNKETLAAIQERAEKLYPKTVDMGGFYLDDVNCILKRKTYQQGQIDMYNEREEEVKRLRDALEKIMSYTGFSVQSIKSLANKALNP